MLDVGSLDGSDDVGCGHGCDDRNHGIDGDNDSIDGDNMFRCDIGCGDGSSHE